VKRGLLIGKFMPLHEGHIALIRFAATQCDELIVSMSYTLNDPIDHQIRFSWINEIFADQPNIKPKQLLDDFDEESSPISVRTKIWAKVIKKIYPPIDVLFSSENYGDYFSADLGVPHIVFDKQRNTFPISASEIRRDPFLHWNFIPSVVRPFFVKRICFYGPESTGKSSMAKKMADKYNTVSVPEVAREMITDNNFTREDIINIGRAQTQRVLEQNKIANKILFCDTDLITTSIYSDIYLYEVPNELRELEKQINYDLYFLFDIDTVWLADGLRDLGDRREEMFLRFRNELEVRRIPFITLRGSWVEKEKIIEQAIQQFILK
jgi:HTH-type transcriptional repressor of NAD biosynthesis genes